MQVVSSTEFRKNIPKYLRESTEQQSPIVVNTRKGAGIFCSLDHWNNLNQKQEQKMITHQNQNLVIAQETSLAHVWNDKSNDAYNDL